MSKNTAINNSSIPESERAVRHKTKKTAAREAREEYIQRRKEIEILNLFGIIDYAPDYDYKEGRKR